MSETKFTPGPWSKPEYENDVGPDDDYFVQWWEINGICKVDEEKNAHLIATAPELYEMLNDIAREAENYYERTGKSTTWLDKAKAVLAKARGEA